MTSCVYRSTLIALYNDLEHFLQEKGKVGLQSITHAIEEYMVYMKLWIPLVIMAESADDLQYALNDFFVYTVHTGN
jgi:hypothetical protein